MRQELQDYLNRRNITANRLSSLAGVGQWTVSRFLTGRTKNVTTEISKVLAYANIEEKTAISGIAVNIDSPRLRAALERNWDGTAEGADKLATLIDAIGPVLRSMCFSSAAGTSK